MTANQIDIMIFFNRSLDLQVETYDKRDSPSSANVSPSSHVYSQGSNSSIEQHADVLNSIRKAINSGQIPVVLVTPSITAQDQANESLILREFVEELASSLNRRVTLLHKKENDYSKTGQVNSIYDSRYTQREKDFLGRLEDLMSASYAREDLNLNFLSDKLGLSSRPLQRRFKSLLGCTPMAYVKKYRIAMAKILLKNTDKTITDIAGDTGFSSPNYFSRSFRELESISPKQYRKYHF